MLATVRAHTHAYLRVLRRAGFTCAAPNAQVLKIIFRGQVASLRFLPSLINLEEDVIESLKDPRISLTFDLS